VTTSANRVALGGMTEMTSLEVRLIADRIEARLASIAEHEAAIRTDLEALASLTSPDADDHLLDVTAAAVAESLQGHYVPVAAHRHAASPCQGRQAHLVPTR